MIYLDNTQDLQEVWVPRNDGIRATRDDCFSTGYDSGYTDGFNDGRMSGASLQEKDVDIVSEVTEITPDEGYDGMSKVTANASGYGNSRYSEGFGEGMNEVISNIVPIQVTVDSDHMEIVTVDPYYGFSEVTIDARDYSRKRYDEGRNEVLSHIVPTAVTMDSENLRLEAEDPNYGFSEVSVDASNFVQGERDKSYGSGYTEGQESILSGIGTTAFTENGVYTAQTDTAQYGWSSVTVNVPQSGGTVINNQTKTVSITANGITDITYDDEYTGLESVKVNVNVPQSGGDVTVITLTQAEYDALDSPDPNAIYLITDGVLGCLDPNKFPFKDYPDLDYKSMDWVSVPQWIDFEGVIDISQKFRDMLSLTEAKIRSNTITTAVDTFNSDTNITDVYIDCPEMVDIRGMFNGDEEIRRAVFTSTKLHDVNVCLDWCGKLEYLEMGGIVNNPEGNRWDDYSIFMAGGGDALTGVTIGTLPDYDLSQIGFSRCSKLTHESLLGLLNALPQATGSYSFGIGGVNISKLSEDEIAIATDKGWSLV